MPAESRLHAALAPILRKGWAHWARMFLLLACGYYAGHLLSKQEWLTQLRYDVYAAQLRLQHRGEMYPQRTAVILIGDDDYYSDTFEARKPLKRDQLAILLDRLNQAGANTVVIDIDLRSYVPGKPEFPTYAPEDAQLLAAVDRMCQAGRHVILSSSVQYIGDLVHYQQVPSIYTDALPHLPCLHPGYIELPVDMRIVPGQVLLVGGRHLDPLSLAAVSIADPVIYDDLVREQTAQIEAESEHAYRFGRFLTLADFAPRAGRQFLFTSTELRNAPLPELHAAIADRIVLLGGHWHSFAQGQGPFVDTYASPGGYLPGVLLHANYIESMLDRTGTFTPVSDTVAEILEGLLVIVLGIISALGIHATWKWGAFFGGLLLSIVFTYVLLQNLGLFLDFLIPLLMIVVHTFVEEILHMRHELHHHRHASQTHHQEPTLP